MGISLKIVDLEREFETKVNPSTIVVNDLDDTSLEQKEKLNRISYTVSGDLFSNVPSCECGTLTGKFNIGMRCDICESTVELKLESRLEAMVWMRAPHGVAPFMNPKMWYILNNYFTRSGFSVLQWIADTNYVPEISRDKYLPVLYELDNLGINSRGWNYFHANFDKIINILLNLAMVKKSSSTNEENELMIDFIQRYRSIMFTRYLPLPNKSLLIIEENESGRYRDNVVDFAINAMRLMVGTDVPSKRYTQRVKENRTVKALNYMIQFSAKSESDNAKREGIFRKHIVGSRSHWCARSVITSLTGTHHYDSLHIPWGVAISLFRYHIMNKLIKEGYTVVQMVNLLNTYALEYHPKLHAIMKELIAESPFRGIPAYHVRNPVMGIGSTQLMYIDDVKTDVSDPTTSTPILSVLPWNLDFDGDAMSTTLTLDNKTARAFQKLSPHISGFSMKEPTVVSHHVWIPKPLVATISNWIQDSNHNQADHVKQERMRNLLT